MAWVGGIFTDRVYDSRSFDTGDLVDEEIMAPPDRALRYAQAHREDEEILTFILNATTSGILEN